MSTTEHRDCHIVLCGHLATEYSSERGCPSGLDHQFQIQKRKTNCIAHFVIAHSNTASEQILVDGERDLPGRRHLQRVAN